MPNQPKTPNRAVRVDDELWNAAKDAAGERGETVTDVVRRALRESIPDFRPDPELSGSFTEVREGEA